jgi:uncharacterized protein (DUF849 family)
LRLPQIEHPGAPWMVAGLDVELGPLVDAAVERGGYVRVGFEDARWDAQAPITEASCSRRGGA